MRSLILPLLLLAACAAPRNDVAWPSTHALADGPTDEEPAFRNIDDRQTARGLIGYTTEREDGGLTIGGQYEFRLREKFGLGPFVDFTFGDDLATVVGGGLFWHPVANLNVLAAPGVDLDNDDFFVRVGASYEFAWNEFQIGPAAYIDLGAHDTPLLLAFCMGYDF